LFARSFPRFLMGTPPHTHYRRGRCHWNTRTVPRRGHEDEDRSRREAIQYGTGSDTVRTSTQRSVFGTSTRRRFICSWRAAIYLKLESNDLFGDFVLRNNNRNTIAIHCRIRYEYCIHSSPTVHHFDPHKDAVLYVLVLRRIRRDTSTRALVPYQDADTNV